MSIQWVEAIFDRRKYESWQEHFDELTSVLAAAGLSDTDEQITALAGIGFVTELKQLFRALQYMHQGEPYQL